MKVKIFIIITLSFFVLISCEHDNYDAPNAILSGKVVYEGEAVGVRTNGTQLELWQDGYELYSKIPVHIAQDGTYSASLFAGQYKLVRLAGAPWESQSNDTIFIDVKGNTNLDVHVNPYFIIKNETFSVNQGSITTTFDVEKIVSTAKIHSVNLYLSKSILTDNIKYDEVEELDVSKWDVDKKGTIVAKIPDNLKNAGYIFARIGVRSTSSSEYIFTPVAKIEL